MHFNGTSKNFINVSAAVTNLLKGSALKTSGETADLLVNERKKNSISDAEALRKMQNENEGPGGEEKPRSTWIRKQNINFGLRKWKRFGVKKGEAIVPEGSVTWVDLC